MNKLITEEAGYPLINVHWFVLENTKEEFSIKWFFFIFYFQRQIDI